MRRSAIGRIARIRTSMTALGMAALLVVSACGGGDAATDTSTGASSPAGQQVDGSGGGTGPSADTGGSGGGPADGSGDGESRTDGAGSPTGGNTGEFVTDGTMTMAISADPGSLDPATAVNGATNLLLSFVYDTLVHTDPDGEIVSGLAESWTVEPTSVTFTLHDGATCADGSPITADDVAASINHTVDPATKSPIVGVLVPADVTATADGPDTVTLSTEEPSPFLLHSTVAIFIVCASGLADGADLATTPAGSGPYTLSESMADDHYTLQRRDDYDWGPGESSTSDPGVPATIELKVVQNETTAANLLLAGDIDVATFSGSDRKRVEATEGLQTSTLAGGNGEFFFNQDPKRAGNDIAVRKALAMSVEIDKLAQLASQGAGTPTTGLTTLSPRPCRVDSVTGHGPQFDPQAAAALLDEAGWVAGPDGTRSKDGTALSLTLLYNTDEGAGVTAAMEYAMAQWRAIGVATELSATASAGFSDALFTSGDWDIAWVPVGLSLPSQFIGYVSGDAPPKGSNFSHVANDEYTELATEAAKTPLDDGGCQVWADAESALFDNVDVLPVVELNQLVAGNDAVVVMPGSLAQPTLFRLLKG